MQSDKRDGESDLSIGKGERKLKWLSDHTCSWLSIPIVSATWRRMEFTCWKKSYNFFWRISTKIQAEANDNVTLLCPLLQAIQHERNERYKDTHHNSFEKSDLNLSLPLPFRICFHTFFCLRRWPFSLRDRCNLCLCRLWGRTQSRLYQPSPSCLWNGYVDVTTHWKRLRKRFLILTKICVTYLLPTANQRHEKIPTGQLYIQLRESTLRIVANALC